MNENLILLTQINELAFAPHPTPAYMAYACLKWREKFQFDTVFLAVSGAPEEPITGMAFDGKEELIASALYRLGVEERITLTRTPCKTFSDITGKAVFSEYGTLKMQKPNSGVFFADFRPKARFILFGLMHAEPKPYPEALVKELDEIWKEWKGPLNQGLDRVLESVYPKSPVKAFPVSPLNEPPSPAKPPEKSTGVQAAQSKAEPVPVDKASIHSAASPSDKKAAPVESGAKPRRAMLLVDEVTRLFNRTYFEESLAIEVERAKRYNRSVSLLFLEVTSLVPLGEKKDEVANQVAEILYNSLRRVDVICRLDTSRYAIILPDTANRTYGIIAKRIFKYFKQIMGGQPDVYINLSASTYPQHVGDHMALYENTEKLLAQAKAAGPNKAVLPD